MHIAGMYDIIRIGRIWQAATVEVTKFEPNLGGGVGVKMKSVQNGRGAPVWGKKGNGNGSEGLFMTQKVLFGTNVQLEGTTLWR